MYLSRLDGQYKIDATRKLFGTATTVVYRYLVRGCQTSTMVETIIACVLMRRDFWYTDLRTVVNRSRDGLHSISSIK